MRKSEAIQLLGGTVAAAAREIGISPQAVGQWPEELTVAIRDRVQAALWRRQASAGAGGAKAQGGGAVDGQAGEAHHAN